MNKNTIIILPEYLANQIAAGEVVQRPESVVKELVENSLDAKASEIVVVITDGGKQLINVIDNGIGMSRPDLELSIKRHATSKIKTQEDLERILTFGFRGEALASISSVADVEIRTRQSDEEIGWKLVSQPLKEPTIEPFNTPVGTQVFVRNLFYNVPARRKFMKSKITEIRHISDTLMRIALINPSIRFTFYSDDNLIFDVHPSDWKTRINYLLGSSTIEGFFELNFENDFMKLSGFIARPELARPTTSGQFLYVNRRPVESRNLAYAVFSAYENLLEKNHKPVFLLNIEIDPEKIDVNIHPQKSEVKFENENFIYNSLRQAVARTLEANNLITNIDFQNNLLKNPFVKLNDENNKSILVNQLTGEVIDSNEIGKPTSHQTHFSEPSISREYRSNNNFDWNNYRKLVENTPNNTFKETNYIERADQPHSQQTPIKLNELDLENAQFWQIFNKYIIVQFADRLILVDQHNAHERVLYERNSNFLFNHSSHKLLFETTVQLSPTEFSIAKEIHQELEDIGFEIKFGEANQIQITAVPEFISYGDEELMLKKILDEYHTKYQFNKITNKEKILASMSCKSAIKTGEKLTQEAMKRLVADLFACENPYMCPHGRPIIIEMKLSELDKQFGRSYKINEIT